VITPDDRQHPFSAMALGVPRVTGNVVGRPAELAAISQELASAGTGRLVGLTLEEAEQRLTTAQKGSS